MKKQLIFLCAVLLLCGSLKTFAQANQDFTLVNKTGVTIYNFYVAPITDSESWGPDLLEGKPLNSGESIDISFDKRDFPNDCIWDLKVYDKDGNSLSWYDIDLCKYYTITLHWDADKGEGTATFE